MKNFANILLSLLFLIPGIGIGKSFDLPENGIIKYWELSTPFENPISGFGGIKDSIPPALSQFDGKWINVSSDKNGYIDILKFRGWEVDKNKPEQIWHIETVYALTSIFSAREEEGILSFGGNTIISAKLNGKRIYSNVSQKNAKPDEDKIKITLNKGENKLLLRIAKSHKNYSVAFFDPLKYEWGFYAKYIPENSSESSVKVSANEVSMEINEMFSTCFFKRDDNLKQKVILSFNNPQEMISEADIEIIAQRKKYKFEREITLGENVVSLFIDELKEDTEAEVTIRIGEEIAKKNILLRKQNKYQLYMMFLSHMDIGYTHPQPIVIERHLKTIDDVIQLCHKDPDFRWTIETTWIVEKYRENRSNKKFMELIELIRSEKIALSPLYTNPYTGWISEQELIESFSYARQLHNEFGIEFYGAVYNDVPGEAWGLPQALSMAGIKFLVNGINEVYNQYMIQRNFPKYSSWKGPDGSKVNSYIADSYDEGTRCGLERGNKAIQNRLWHKLSKLEKRNYPYDKVLLDVAFSDNSGIPVNQYLRAKEWNKEWEYPKFIPATVNDFAKDISDIQPMEMYGDWTSSWDIRFQGEHARMQKYRKTQNMLSPIEAVAFMESDTILNKKTARVKMNSVYNNLLLYSGHGSGLEYGFGSPEDNILTDDFREYYVESARLTGEEINRTNLYRITRPMESFDTYGVAVFNSLSWKRSGIVELSFVNENFPDYHLIDPINNKVMPTVKRGNKIYFSAEDLPPFGYKIFRIEKREVKNRSKVSEQKIENDRWEIGFNKIGEVEYILDKGNGRNPNKILTGKSFELLKRTYREDKFYSGINASITGIEYDKNELFEKIEINYSNSLIMKKEISLLQDSDDIEIKIILNLEELEEPTNTEEYSLAFFSSEESDSISFDILGGMISPEEKFPGISKNDYSIRRVAEVNEDYQYLVASPDARIFQIENEGKSNLILANLVNNFPKNWNRNERNEGTIEFDFSVKINETNKKISPLKYGWEKTTPIPARVSYYLNKPIEKSLIEISNENIALLSIRNGDKEGSYELLLQNINQKNEIESIVRSERFKDKMIERVDLMGKVLEMIPNENDGFGIKLRPNEIAKIIVNNQTP